MLKRALLPIILIIFAFFLNAFINPIPKKRVPAGFNPKYGVTYSFEQAGWYGLDARQAYIDLITNYEFDWVRLPFFWDQMMDAESGEFNQRFNDLKFAVEEAAKHDVEVIIALGAKTPYFPEYHWPKEISDEVGFGEVIDINHPVAKDILKIDKRVIEELSQYENIIFWQVENEPLIGNVNKWKIDSSLIAAEVEVVRKTDPKARPIILNHAATGFYDTSWHELLKILQPGDVFAVNAFFKTKGTDIVSTKIFGREMHILWPNHLVWPVHSWGIFSPDFASIKKKVEANGNELWVLEMQSEPYIKKLEEAEDPVLSYTPKDILAADSYLRLSGVSSIGFWGAHYWQFRQKLGDDSWLETVKSIVN